MIDVKDDKVMSAFKLLIKEEGIIPALESAHAISGGLQEAAKMSSDQSVLINLSGRGDKDIFSIAQHFDDEGWRSYLRSLY